MHHCAASLQLMALRSVTLCDAGCDENAEFSRPDVVKFIWDYIKKNDLQDPKNRRNIVADENLKLIFTFPLNMFSLNKQLSKHLKSSGSTITSSDAPPKKRAKKKDPSENGEKKKTGFAAPLKLSDALAEVVGLPAASRGAYFMCSLCYLCSTPQLRSVCTLLGQRTSLV